MPIYHKSLDTISIAAWFEVMNGEKSKLNKLNNKYTPIFFDKLISDMIFQIPHLDLTKLKEMGDLAVLNSIAARTKNKGIQFDADSLRKKIEKDALKESDNVTLDDFVDFIEISFNDIGKFNPRKFPASRAYSLFYKAKERNKVLNSKKKNNGSNRK